MLDYNILYRWFPGWTSSSPPSTRPKNPQRLLQYKVARAFLVVVVRHAQRRHLVSDEHFTVDGTLVEAEACL